MQRVVKTACHELLKRLEKLLKLPPGSDKDSFSLWLSFFFLAGSFILDLMPHSKVNQVAMTQSSNGIESQKR